MRYDRPLQIRVDDEWVAHLDSVRGPMSRSEFIRQAVTGSRPHRHERKRVIRTVFDRGAERKVWACDCGQEML